MEKQQKKQVKKYISWALIVVIVGFLAVLPMIAANEENTSGPQASVLTATAENRSISSVILGGGTLIAEDAVEITIPSAVKVKEYLVKNGDFVTEGQVVAKVDRVSVMTAITQVQETLDELNSQLNKVSSNTASTKITAPASGTVKVIYASVGENVQDVMLRDGALAVLSLDGLMAVQITRNTNLNGGDTVCVSLSDGTEITGKVESNLEGVLTITLEDKDYAIGETVKVTTEDGVRIGSGKLYVHSQWNVVEYSGKISRIRVSEGDDVYADRILFNLENDGHTAEYDALARKHRKYEELMLELFKMYQSETVCAPSAGLITGVDKNGTFMLSSSESGWTISLLANAPDGTENTYTNLAVLVSEVGIDGLILKVNPTPFAISDYKDLPAGLLNTSLMTESIVYSIGNTPIYELTEVIPEGGTGTTAPPAGGNNGSGTPTTGGTTTGGNITGGTTTEGGTTGGTNPTEGGTTAGGTTGGTTTGGTAGGTTSGGGTTGGSTPGSGTTNPPVPVTPTKEWVQISSGSIIAGDVLLFAFDGTGPVWIVRVANVGTGNTPTQPSTPTQPNTSQGSSRPSGGIIGGMSGIGGGMSGMGGGMPQQEADDGLYDLDTVTIASVTAQTKTTIQIVIDELDISQVYVGQTAIVTVDALTGQQFTGAVTEISASGENEGGSSKFTVKVTVDKVEDMLAGMNAAVSLVVSATENVTCIPVAALIENGTETVVYTGYDEETEAFLNPVTVTTGVSDGEYVQILSGIAQGQTVYYPYYDTLVISTAPEMGGFRF